MPFQWSSRSYARAELHQVSVDVYFLRLFSTIASLITYLRSFHFCVWRSTVIEFTDHWGRCLSGFHSLKFHLKLFDDGSHFQSGLVGCRDARSCERDGSWRSDAPITCGRCIGFKSGNVDSDAVWILGEPRHLKSFYTYTGFIDLLKFCFPTLTLMVADQMVKEVEKAIRNSPLKLNPMEEGEVLRVPIPK